MNIGIFGDSFTCSHPQSEHFAWYTQLAQKLNGTIFSYEINQPTTYGLGGSPTFYSYKKFLKYQHNHDLIIFVASDAIKYTKLIELKNYGEKPISGYNNLENYRNLPYLTDDEKDLIKHIESWFLSVDQQFMTTVQDLILRDIEQKANVVILAADNNTAFTTERSKISAAEFGLWNFAEVMYNDLRIPRGPERGEERPDKIAAHMTKEANVILADLLYDYITFGKRMKLPTKISHAYPRDYYFGK